MVVFLHRLSFLKKISNYIVPRALKLFWNHENLSGIFFSIHFWADAKWYAEASPSSRAFFLFREFWGKHYCICLMLNEKVWFLRFEAKKYLEAVSVSVTRRVREVCLAHILKTAWVALSLRGNINPDQFNGHGLVATLWTEKIVTPRELLVTPSL